MRRNGGLYRIHYYDKQEKKKENKGFSLNFFSPSSAMILIVTTGIRPGAQMIQKEGQGHEGRT